MIDPTVVGDKIFKLVTEIQDAVKDAKLNMAYCDTMETVISTVKITVNQKGFEITEGEKKALKDLQAALHKANNLIKKCRKQDKKFLRRLFNAKDTADELRRTHMEIDTCISVLKLAESDRHTKSLTTIEQTQRDVQKTQREMQQTQGLILQLLFVRLDDVPQEEEVTGSIQTSPTMYSVDDTALSANKRSEAELVLPQGMEPTDFLAQAVGLKKYSLTNLTKAVNFKNQIGMGAKSLIYKGEFEEGKVAVREHFRLPLFFVDLNVKSLREVPNEMKDLVKELKLLSTLDHKNIIKLLGYCVPRLKPFMVQNKYGTDLVEIEDSMKFYSVTRYMPNGSLKDIIDGNEKQDRIGWASLVQIIQGIAKGVLYLHNQQVVHLDLNPSHILLDSDMTPKINQFGSARVFGNGVDCIKLELDHDEEEGRKNRAFYPYTAPEHFGLLEEATASSSQKMKKKEATVSTKSDVFSFGVIVIATLRCMCKSQGAPLDLFSGHPNPEQWLEWVQKNDWINIFDETRVTDEFEQTTARWLLTVALRCCVRMPADRPSMSEVVNLLSAACNTKPWYEVWYEVLTQDDLKELMNQDKRKIAKVLNVADGVAERLLVWHEWISPHEVINKWYEAQAAWKDIGLRSRDDEAIRIDVNVGTCRSCDTKLLDNMSTGSCEHYFCETCWSEYIENKVTRNTEVKTLRGGRPGGQRCLYMQCPEKDCGAPVCREIVEWMGEDIVKRYDKYALDWYVHKRSSMIKWCPGEDCDMAIKFHGCFRSDGVEVLCDRNHRSSWSCKTADHPPEEQCDMHQEDGYRYE